MMSKAVSRVKFGYRRFARNASLGGIVLPSGTIHEECGSIYAYRHIGKFSLGQLVC